MKLVALLLSLAAATPLLAQGTPQGTSRAPAIPLAKPTTAVGAAGALWEGVTAYVTRAAEQMPEADYAYRPVATVRTFGQMIGHIAGAQHMFCAIAIGERPNSEDNIEKTRTTKAALVDAMRTTSEYCRRAYAQTDAAATGTVKLFGADRTRLYTLIMNAMHNGEHYGNLVTYMRAKGMVPPSSQPRQ